MTAALRDVLVSNTLLAVAVGLVGWLALLVARRPAVAHLLFVIAILKLMTPALVPLPAFAAADQPTSAPAALPAATEAPGPLADAAPGAPGPPSVGRVTPAPLPPEPPGWSWPVALAWAWAIGSLLVAGTTGLRLRSLRRTLAGMRPAPAWLTTEVAALGLSLGVRRAPELRIVDADVSPAVVRSHGRYWLLFPAPLLDALSAGERRTLLAHELAHVRRRDPWFRVLEVVATAVLWWQPVLWWLRAGLRAAEERSCDAWVAAVLPDGRGDYCRALLRAGRSGAPPVHAFASPARRIRRWQNRLEDIMCRHVPHRPSAAARGSVSALAIAVLPLALAQEPAAAPTNIAAKLAIKVEVDFAKATIDEWTAWLGRATGAGFEVTAAARRLDPAQTTLAGVKLPSIEARRVLDVIAAITDLSWRITDDRVVIDSISLPLPRVTDSAAGEPTITVYGAVSSRGIVPIAEPATIFRVITQVEPDEDADLGRVSLIRPDGVHPLVVEVDVLWMMKTGNTAQNVVVRAGDIVYVPRRADPLPPLRLRPGSRLQFVVPPALVQTDGCERLALLAEPQAVSRDGTIFVPCVGPVYVGGMTREDVTSLITQLCRAMVKRDIQLNAQFLPLR